LYPIMSDSCLEKSIISQRLGIFSCCFLGAMDADLSFARICEPTSALRFFDVESLLAVLGSLDMPQCASHLALYIHPISVTGNGPLIFGLSQSSDRSICSLLNTNCLMQYSFIMLCGTVTSKLMLRSGFRCFRYLYRGVFIFNDSIIDCSCLPLKSI
jgi:hypothetical protein